MNESGSMLTGLAPRRCGGRRAFLLAVLGLTAGWRSLSAREFQVAPIGSDANPGTATAPFATVARARDAVRALKAGPGLPAEGVTVWLRGGIYPLAATVSFDGRDSGTATAPVVYAGWPGEEVRVAGGRLLDPLRFAPVGPTSAGWSRLDAAARGQVYVADLRAAGITDFGTLRPRGFGLSAAAPLELFCDGRPMTLAQWPNRRDPWVRTVAAASRTEFTYAGTRPERWAQANEIWLHGFWEEAWADFHVKVAAIDPARKTFTLAAPPASYGLLADRPYIAYNLLEEIDEPGEYFVDRAAGLLYFWPPAPLAGTTLQISQLESSLLQFAGTQHVTWREVGFEAGRGGLVRIDSGDHLRFERCVLRNAGQWAAAVAGASNGFDHCEIVDCGEDGVRLSGGNRATLTAGENFVTNSRLHRVSRLAWTYHPAIAISGCGQRAAHNLIDDLPHSAILFGGNNHVLEANEIRRVCRISSDAGAIYIGRDWGFRGNAVRGNFIHHIVTEQEGFGAHGVYLDDCVSGVEVSGNVFHRIDDIAIMAGGGRDLVMRGNLIAACGFGHRNDDRGRTRITNTPGDSWNLLAKLSAEGLRYQEAPWSLAYPACAAMPNSWTAVQAGLWRNPEGCVFSGNAGWDNVTWMAESNPSGTGVFSVYASRTDNDPAQPALFDDAAGIDRARRPVQLRAASAGFAPIAFAAIGRTWAGQPAATAPPPASVLEGRVESGTAVNLWWSDDGNVPRVQENGFLLERRNLPDGAWQTVGTWGADVNFTTQTGLAPATAYAFRVRATNAAGTTTSGECAMTTDSAPWVAAGAAVRTEAESVIAVVNDTGTLGTVGASNATLDSGLSVRLYDPGDAVRIAFSVPVAGVYRVGVRVRSGSGAGPRSYWPNGYRFKLDDGEVVLRGDAASVSAVDPSYGTSYWGTMQSGPVTLAAGAHTVEVRAVSSFGVVDFAEVVALVPRPITTFPDWQASRFSADQLTEAAIAGAAARPAGDTLPNLLKYALGLDPWSKIPGTGVRVVAEGGQIRLTYSRPVGLSDVGWSVEVSDDGKTWSVVPQAVVVPGATKDTMAASVAGAPQRVVRLRVTRGAESVASGAWSGTTAESDTSQPRLRNLSVRAASGAGGAVLIAGFSVAGNGNKPLLLRAVGPGLAAFGVGDVLGDPRLDLFREGVRIAGNDNWSAVATETPALTATAARVGAFALSPGSWDAAMLTAAAPGAYTVHVTDAAGRAGVALAELYDAEAANGAARLGNLSARGQVGNDGAVLIAGFQVTGVGELVVLMRGVGPALARFGLSGVLADPVVAVFRGGDEIGRNDDWGAQTTRGSEAVAAVGAAAARVGAFALEAGAKDAALLLSLPAGTYTAQVSGRSNATGIALVEVYEVP